MSYNSEMQENNEGLQRILNAVNNLPNAGSDALFPVIIDWDTNTASHTPAEIKAAKDANKLVFTTDRYGYPFGLYETDDTMTRFNAVYGVGALWAAEITIDTDKNVSMVGNDATVAIPTFDLTEMGMPAVPITNGRVEWYHDTRDLYSALKAGTVKIKYTVLSLSGDEEHMECTVNGLANLDASFVQVTVLGQSTGGNRPILYANVYEDGVDAYTGSLGGLEIDTIDMGLTLKYDYQHREITEAVFDKLWAIAAAGPVRLLWQINFGTESNPSLADYCADLTPMTRRFHDGVYDSITFATIDGRYSHYISFFREGSYYGVDYQAFTYEAS